MGATHMPNTRRAALAAAAALAAGALAACSLDLQNPNAPTEPQVTTSVDGVVALATGLQGRFAQSYGAFAYMGGLVTDEFVRLAQTSDMSSEEQQRFTTMKQDLADRLMATPAAEVLDEEPCS